MIAFVPREKISKNWIFVAPILSIVFTIFFGLLIFTFLGYNPIETLYQIFVSPFSRIDRISDILVKACPLIIIGTGLMLCFKSNVWNIGAEGQFIMGALLAGFIALSFPNIETKFFLLITIFSGFGDCCLPPDLKFLQLLVSFPSLLVIPYYIFVRRNTLFLKLEVKD